MRIYISGAITKDKNYFNHFERVEKELKSKLEQLAKEDCRSLTSFINKILIDYVKDK